MLIVTRSCLQYLQLCRQFLPRFVALARLLLTIIRKTVSCSHRGSCSKENCTQKDLCTAQGNRNIATVEFLIAFRATHKIWCEGGGSDVRDK